MTRTVPSALLALTAAAAAALYTPVAHADDDTAPQCGPRDVTVRAAAAEAAVGHRAVPLIFSLADGAQPCTLLGYPGVDSGTGGPTIHAERSPRGYMGGLPFGVDAMPTVTLSSTQQGHTVVEGMATDADGYPCPTYTDIRVTVPDTTDTVTVAAAIEACALQVHPITAD